MNRIALIVDGQPVEVPAGASVAGAIAQAGAVCGHSPGGRPRAPLCGMGVCFECRTRIDGVPQQRACMVEARAGMRVETTR